MGKRQIKKAMNIKFSKVIGTIFGLGYLPYAPGTVGSLVGLLACVLLRGNVAAYFIVFMVFFFTGVISSAKIEEVTKIKDPAYIIIDEFAGMFVVFFMLPMNIMSASLGFLFFRVFDILKPPPIRSIEKIPGGWGIMMDDLLAGVFANLLLRVALKFLM